MNWSVIYSFEMFNEHRGAIDRYTPHSGEWELTEDDDQFEGYDDIEEGVHRKYCGFLTDEEFREFLDDVLYPWFVEPTAGMIGGMTPGGMSIGWMPAWSLSPDGDPYAFWMNAYVCPFPETDEEEAFLTTSEEDVREWIEKEYVR